MVRNPSFTDYLIPTALDMPDVTIAALIEEPEPGAPFGAKGVGEPPTISSTPAVAAARPRRHRSRTGARPDPSAGHRAGAATGARGEPHRPARRPQPG